MAKKFESFEKTYKVLEEIEIALANLQKSFELKKENIKNVKSTTEQSIKQIDILVSKLDKVLK